MKQAQKSSDRLTRNVPLIKPDLPPFDEVAGLFEQAMVSGRVTNFGANLKQFESEAAEFLGRPVATVSSGSMGLLFALQSWGLQRGQKVILPSFTFMATAQAIVQAGGVPLFADINDELTIAVDDLKQLLDQHDDVAAVMPVHMYGLPCHVDQIKTLVDEYSQKRSRRTGLIYDAAHAFGSAVDDRCVGSFGDAEVFSLSVTKALSSVEGGMIAADDEAFLDRIRKMRNYGIENNYNAAWPGLNGKMSEFHAIVGVANLRRLPGVMETREKQAAYYENAINTRTGFVTIARPSNITHTFKDFTILVPEGKSDRRPHIVAFLKERGIETRSYFDPPVHQQDYFRKYTDRPLPKTDALAARVLTIPFFTTIEQADMDYVVDQLVEAENAASSGGATP